MSSSMLSAANYTFIIIITKRATLYNFLYRLCAYKIPLDIEIGAVVHYATCSLSSLSELGRNQLAKPYLKS